jgi:hypothetical protein
MTSISRCFDCMQWADKITKLHAIAQLQLGIWARGRRHEEVHAKLREQAIALDKNEKSASLDQWTGTINYAIKYHALGLSVVPLQSKEKRSFPSSSLKKLFSPPAPDVELGQWFNEARNNIAITSGKVSRLDALDIDCQLPRKSPHECTEATA